MIAQIPEIDRAIAARAAAEIARMSNCASASASIRGDVFVGNMGSQQRFDYSIVGDPVNVAARLESLTKEYGVAILVAEATARAAQGFRFVDLGEADLKGRSAATRVHALHGAAGGDDASFAEFLKLHAAVLAAAGAAAADLAAAIASAAGHPHGARYAGFYATLAAHGAAAGQMRLFPRRLVSREPVDQKRAADRRIVTLSPVPVDFAPIANRTKAG